MKNIKSNIISTLIGLVLILVVGGFVNAQQALPASGSDFETATMLQQGTYQGSLAEGEIMYYRIQGNAGQQIRVEASSGDAELVIYNDKEEELQYSGADKFVYWLFNSEKSTQSLYLKIYNEAFGPISFTLKVSLANYYDANSQTDAGDTIGKALDITLGEHQGYLAGYGHIMALKGNDFKDYYKVPVEKGITYIFKATPSTADRMSLELFNSNRELVDDKTSANPGAVVNLSLTPAANTNVFVAVGSVMDITEEVLDYKLSISSSDVSLKKFYACDNGYCMNVGEYSSQEECEETTTKVCYQDSHCDDQCEAFAGSDLEQIISQGFPALLDFSISPRLTFFKKSLLIGGLLFSILFYVYLAICLQVIAKKTKTPNGWLAWIPIANVFLLIQIAQKPLWWFLLFFIPIVNIVIAIIIWMKIAERRDKPSWLGVLIIVPIASLILPGYLAFSNKEEIETTPPYVGTGTQEANKPTVGYKHPCKYCEKLIPPNSAICPLCGKVNPLGPLRCPKCHEPTERSWQTCSRCNQNLRIVCPFCGKITFFGDHCEDCETRLLVECPHCGQEQPPLDDNCMKCGKSLQEKK